MNGSYKLRLFRSLTFVRRPPALAQFHNMAVVDNQTTRGPFVIRLAVLQRKMFRFQLLVVGESSLDQKRILRHFLEQFNSFTNRHHPPLFLAHTCKSGFSSCTFNRDRSEGFRPKIDPNRNTSSCACFSITKAGWIFGSPASVLPCQPSFSPHRNAFSSR